MDNNYILYFYIELITHKDQDNMADVLYTAFSKAFSLVKMLVLWDKFHWSVTWPVIQNVDSFSVVNLDKLVNKHSERRVNWDALKLMWRHPYANHDDSFKRHIAPFVNFHDRLLRDHSFHLEILSRHNLISISANQEISFNSLKPSDTYMRQYTYHHWFIQWLVGANPLSEPMQVYC